MPKPTPPPTAQSLGALLKSARDIMRKDKGLNGDLDRLPMLTWIVFLKFFDDLKLQREGEARLTTKKFKPAIEPPYRWRDWAAKSDGITGDELLAFINNEETTRPDGKKGAGLFRYLRTLTSSNGDDRREVIATVFRGVQNRMVSGYLLRDVINKLNGIRFNRQRRVTHARRALRIHAPRDARCRGRFRRVLHPARRCAPHGRRQRPAPRRDRARSRLRHGRLPRRGVQSPFQTGQNRGRPPRLAGPEPLRLRTQVTALSALPDESRAARPRRPAD